LARSAFEGCKPREPVSAGANAVGNSNGIALNGIAKIDFVAPSKHKQMVNMIKKPYQMKSKM